MIIYVEEILFVNYAVQSIVIGYLKRIYHFEYSHIRFFFFCLLDTLYLLFFFKYSYIFKYFVFPFGIFFCNLMIPKKEKQERIKITLAYFAVHYFLGGLFYSLPLSNKRFILYPLLTIFLCIHNPFLHSVIREPSLFYSIKIKGMCKRINCFLDTGNFLKYKNYPVIILNQKYKNLFPIRDSIMIETLSNRKNMNISGPVLIQIQKEGVDYKKWVYLSFEEIPFEGILGLDVCKKGG